MSGLGNNFFTSENSTNSDSEEDEDENEDEEDDDDDSLFDRIGDKIGDKIDDGKDKVKDKFDEIGNDLADGLSDKLNISGWYSLHVLTYCEGEWENTTENRERRMEVTKCSEPSPDSMYPPLAPPLINVPREEKDEEGKKRRVLTRTDRFNIADILNGSSLTVGPLEIPIPSGIQRQVSKLNSVLHAVLVFYAISVTLAGLAFFTNIAALFLPDTRPYEVTMANAALSSGASLFLLLGSSAMTVAGVLTAEALGDLGEIVGIKITRGIGFVSITWAAFGVIAAAATYWGWKFLTARKERKNPAAGIEKGY